VGPSFGYTLSSEEHGPSQFVRHAQRAEELGFDFVSIGTGFFAFWHAAARAGPALGRAPLLLQ
jgi:coenzyme F420-dependent glucose-6-phosphate dehydrogenase